LHWRPFLFFVVPDAEFNINMLEDFAKVMPELQPKLEGLYLTFFCGDTYKMGVSGNYNTLWQRFWMCENLAYDPEPGDIEVLYMHLFFSSFITCIFLECAKCIVCPFTTCSTFV
jgi:hypothetical protein